jgi:hypothetical protein
MQSGVEPAPSAIRRLLLVAGVVAVLAASGLLTNKLLRSQVELPYDVAVYWVGGRLNAEGANPYDGTSVHEMQRAIGLTGTAIMMWHPPWTLTLVMPIGMLPPRIAYGIWILTNLALLIASTELLWRGFGGRPGQRWIAHLLALTSAPTVFLIGGAQITAIVLFGLAGFLTAAKANRPFLAGMVGALTAIKPHLLLIFALWLVFDAFRSRFGRRVVAGGVLVGAAACILPTLANPEVWSQYVAATTGPSSADHYNLTYWSLPLAGWWLRSAVPGQPFWVQWLPLAIAVLAFSFWYRAVRRSGERSVEDLPWIVGVSLLAAPYGVWQYDLILLLVPLLAVAVKFAERPTPIAIAIGLLWLMILKAIAFVMMLHHTPAEWYVWFAPSLLLGCVAVLRFAARPQAMPAPTFEPAGV